MGNTGCGSKQVAQDINEAEDQNLRGEEELHQVTIETIRRKSWMEMSQMKKMEQDEERRRKEVVHA